MLAKMWKKILLFICIVAILFNITSKLVYKTNLVTQLKSVIGGSSLSDIFEKDDTTINSEQNVEKNNKKENTIQVNKVTVVIN